MKKLIDYTKDPIFSDNKFDAFRRGFKRNIKLGLSIAGVYAAIMVFEHVSD